MQSGAAPYRGLGGLGEGENPGSPRLRRSDPGLHAIAHFVDSQRVDELVEEIETEVAAVALAKAGCEPLGVDAMLRQDDPRFRVGVSTAKRPRRGRRHVARDQGAGGAAIPGLGRPKLLQSPAGNGAFSRKTCLLQHELICAKQAHFAPIRPTLGWMRWFWRGQARSGLDDLVLAWISLFGLDKVKSPWIGRLSDKQSHVGTTKLMLRETGPLCRG
jgi:hypothetical protein